MGLEELGREIDKFAEKKHEVGAFYHFEPWDVGKRPDWVIQQAAKDGVDLYSEMMLRHVGKDPHTFQTGFLLSNAFFRVVIAGNQVGKSLVTLMDILIMLTGEIPIALRFPEGADTGVKRGITADNIHRFGRFEAKTHRYLDRKVPPEGIAPWREWDCGNIKGAGVYPASKVAPAGSTVWLGTYLKAFSEHWWPLLFEESKCIIPPHLIDRKKGANGYNKRENTVHLVRDCRIVCITYESGYNRFEAEKVHHIVLDEEPDDPRLFQAALQHTKTGVTLDETPYRGLTYTKALAYPDSLSPEKKTFHATQYDSPYQNREEIAIKRESMPQWEIGARVWGMHTDAAGEPYFDRNKVGLWMQRYIPRHAYMRLVPKTEWFGIANQQFETKMPTLTDVNITAVGAADDNEQDTWRIYEMPRLGTSYLATSDPAEGADTPEDAQDTSCAIIGRMKTPSEMEEDDADSEVRRVKIVATLRSTLETVQFAKPLLYGLRFYNNATLAAETKRHASNATLFAEVKDWPYWFKSVTIQDSTRKPRQLRGFDMTSATRPAIFDLIKAWISEATTQGDPGLPDETLLRELYTCMVGKNNRPDHPRDGTLDMVVCFGILLYVFRNFPEQIQYHGPEQKTQKFEKMRNLLKRNEDEPVPYGIGEEIPDVR